MDGASHVFRPQGLVGTTGRVASGPWRVMAEHGAG